MTTVPILLLALSPAAPADDTFFEKEVRSVLVERCVKCHGPVKASGGLRLDSREALLKGGESGPAVIPGKPADSRLVKALRREKGVEPMPPDKALDPAVTTALEKWVRDGAAWPATAAPVRVASHWAFEPVRPQSPPAGAAHPIDAFLRAKPAEPANRRALIRRVTFDLIGLPPTPEEIDHFLADTSPDAYERLIDRLLASPHYGEKWGRHWLDVVRYADTAGETADFPVPDAWRYRNYVIAAFNRDLPYDQFLREQLAGDILAARDPTERYAERVAATGYLALARRFGYDVRKDHFLTLEDTIDTVGKSVLGLTLGCARCHDHKYDPVTARDYYALYGIFESTRYAMSGCEKVKTQEHLVPLVPPAESVPRFLAPLSATRSWAEVSLRVADADPPAPTAYAVWEGSPHDAQLHKRGDPETRGDAVPRRFLTVLGGQPLPSNAGSGRLALADWLTDPKNPLTARVMVNRVWQGHLGTGIVATPNDFGTRGAPPTHPELLDWLAAEFVRSGWSVKHLHRLFLTSEAYRAGAHRRRLTAEEIRDSLLAVSGDLDPSPGGPHPFPDPKTWNFTQHGPFKAVYETDRRSVYLMTQRIQRHPFLALFDGPDPNASTATRQTTTVPTQALFFLNDPFVHKCADHLAGRLDGLSTEARLDRSCWLLYGRPAGEADRRAAERFLAGGDWPAWLRVMLASNEFVYID
jgi:hypothetical protein